MHMNMDCYTFRTADAGYRFIQNMEMAPHMFSETDLDAGDTWQIASGGLDAPEYMAPGGMNSDEFVCYAAIREG